MSKINKEEYYLCRLLGFALNEKEPEQEDGIDYKKLLSLAKKHQVFNAVYPLLDKLDGVPDEEKARFRDHTMSELKRMLVVNNERDIIFAELTSKSIRFMPLKGLIIKAYYPKESMRQMSDNDILFDFENRDEVARIMKSNGYKTVATGENSDDYHKEPYSTFEFHRTLFFEEHNFCPRFDDLWERATQDGENPYLYHMDINDVYIYNVCHMFKHFSSAGCGVRFLADNFLLLKKDGKKLDFGYVSAKLDEYGILDFERKTRELAIKLFSDEELSYEEEELLGVFLNFGIFGSEKIKLSRELEAMSKGASINSAKRSYVLKRLFPPKKKMIADYRALEKRPYLLPAYYAYRLIKGALHPKETLGEVKSVNSINNK